MDIQINGYSTLTLMNALGEQIMQKMVIGRRYRLDITELSSKSLNLKIETEKATYMKKIK